MSVDVIIPTWQGRELLARCLAALAADGADLTVIVVDNASQDGTVDFLQDTYPDVTVVELAENVGFGRAVNAGVRMGSSEAIVLVNNDVMVQPGFIAAITAPLADAQVGMVAGMTLMPGSQLVDGFGIELDVTLAAYNRLRGLTPEASAGGVLAMPSGGAAAYRRAAFQQAGGFDEHLFAYGEDVDLGLRLRAAGWQVVAAPDARGEHLGGATVVNGSPWQRRLAGFARGYLLRRYGVLRSRAALRALVFELLVIGWGMLRFGTLIPLRSRIEGWRAVEAGDRHQIPLDAIDLRISAVEAFRRLRSP